jgi:hypothetical protein
MARTAKWEHASDSWHIGHRLERQARQPQRDRAAFSADLALDEDNDLDD